MKMKTKVMLLLPLLVLCYFDSLPACSVETAKPVSIDQAAIQKVAASFAAFPILGTGSQRSVASIKIISSTQAIAVLDDDDVKNAYTVNMKKIKKRWKVVSYEYIFIPTGENKFEEMKPPYPDPFWERAAARN